MPTPVVSTSISCAPRAYFVTRDSPSERYWSPATSGSISALVAATMRRRTTRILFLVCSVGEPAHEGGEIHDRRAVFDWRDLVDHVAVGRRAVRHRPGREIVLFGKQLDARRLPVDVDAVADVEAVVRFGARGLPQLARDLGQVERQALHVHGGLLRGGRMRSTEDEQPDE